MAATDTAGSEAVPVPAFASASMRPVELPSTPSLPLPFGPSLSYAQTSQARNWRFSTSALARIRSEANLAARRRLEAIWSEEHAASSSSSAPSIPFLSVDDELALITYYLVKVGQIVRAFGLPELVEATATTFVKRFYLRNTCMDFHPKNIVITCIFLASKAENYALNLGEFARKLAGKSNERAVIEENRRTVLDLEFLVSQSLQFEYAVTGAHRALYGLLLDLQSLPDNQAPAREELHKIAAAAHARLSTSRLTDAEFVYTPSQIALACVRGAAPDPKIVDSWINAKQSRARTVALAAKASRTALRDAETARAAKAKIAHARRTKGKAGAKAVEEQLAAAAATPQQNVEFDDAQIEADPLGMSIDELTRTLDEINALIDTRETGGYTGQGKGAEDVDRVKEIDKRQKLCMNPEKDPASTVYRKRQADAEDAQAANKKQRTSGANADSDDDDVPVAKDFAVKPEPAV
jgi:cyclin H